MIELEKSYFNIIIIGVGGTGSHLVSFLTQLIGNDHELKYKVRLILVDEDIVEKKNLKTQKFLDSDVGKCKAEVLADRYSAVFGIDIDYKDKFITCEEDINKLINWRRFNMNNIIVSCVDNNKARAIIDKTFNNITSPATFIYIDTGNSSGSDELTGQTVVGCLKDANMVLPSVGSYFPNIYEPEKEVEMSCSERMLSNIQNIGANITSATTVFNILNSIISFNIIPGNLFTFNASKLEAERMDI